MFGGKIGTTMLFFPGVKNPPEASVIRIGKADAPGRALPQRDDPNRSDVAGRRSEIKLTAWLVVWPTGQAAGELLGQNRQTVSHGQQ
jgi:hypothetical protein